MTHFPNIHHWKIISGVWVLSLMASTSTCHDANPTQPPTQQLSISSQHQSSWNSLKLKSREDDTPSAANVIINTTTTSHYPDAEAVVDFNSSSIISNFNRNESKLNSSTQSQSWQDGNWRRRDKSRVAAVVVYASVILIALVGVLIKYFVTQYEMLQAKAQLEYQQLRTLQTRS